MYTGFPSILSATALIVNYRYIINNHHHRRHHCHRRRRRRRYHNSDAISGILNFSTLSYCDDYTKLTSFLYFFTGATLVGTAVDVSNSTTMQNAGTPSDGVNFAPDGDTNRSTGSSASSRSAAHRKAWEDTRDEEKRALCEDTDPPAARPADDKKNDVARSANSSVGGSSTLITTSSAVFVDTHPPNVPIMPLGKKEGRAGSGTSTKSRKSAWDQDSSSDPPHKDRPRSGRRGKRRKGNKNGDSRPVELQEVNGQLRERDVDSDAEMADVSCMESIKGFSKVFKSKKFKSPHLEQLYQRYFFSLNKSSFNNLVMLLAFLLVVMIVVHYGAGQTTPYKGVFLGLFIIIFIAMFAVCSRNSCTQKQLQIMCYAVLVMFAVISILDILDSFPRSATNGVWTTLFFIYMVYTLLPIRMRLAVLSGGMLMILHIICAASKNREDTKFLWKQVRRPFNVLETEP